ncbi:MAG: hypothetical protein QXY62_00700 [Candidatus Altiarchaeota archaeon]
MQKKVKFLADLKENEKAVVEVFIPQIYGTMEYYCKNCKKFSGKICDCGKFPEPIFRISGILTDGTKTLQFRTLSIEASERLSGVKKDFAKDIDIKAIMKKPHVIFGYLNKGKFLIEKVLE